MINYKPFKENMILIDKNIIELCEKHSLISPFEKNNLSGCAYDLRVGSILKSRNKGKSFNLSEDKEYIIESGECVTIDTLEQFNLRNVILFAIIYNKHSILAKGIFHPITTIDPGFIGNLALTFFNLGNIPFPIRYKDKIASVYFHSFKSVPSSIYGVTQAPSYKEGNTEVALLIEKPHIESSEEDLKKMYGKPMEIVFDKIKSLEDKLKYATLEIEANKNKRFIDHFWKILIPLITAVLASLITIYWKTIYSFFAGT